METLEEKLKRVLERGLANGQTELETLPNGHVCGQVISTAFRGQDYEERRKLVKSVLDAGLTKDELMSVSTLLTYSPEEWSVSLEDA